MILYRVLVGLCDAGRLLSLDDKGAGHAGNHPGDGAMTSFALEVIVGIRPKLKTVVEWFPSIRLIPGTLMPPSVHRELGKSFRQ